MLTAEQQVSIVLEVARIVAASQKLDEMFMNSPAIPIARQIIRAPTMKDAQEVAEIATHLDSAIAVQEMVCEKVRPAVVR